jgi:hypothetical protein
MPKHPCASAAAVVQMAMPTAHDSLYALIAETGGARLADQLRFVREIDRLKGIVRQTPLIDGSHNETDAEHT